MTNVLTFVQICLFIGKNILMCCRNLKPANVLLDGEASFMLCDFSTETLMTDEMKWKIRVEEGSEIFFLISSLFLKQKKSS